MYNLQKSKESVNKAMPVKNIVIHNHYYGGPPPSPSSNSISSVNDLDLDQGEEGEGEREREGEREGEGLQEEQGEPQLSNYNYENKTYFIDNEKYLQKDFTSITENVSMNLCIYKCVRKGCCPYLQYLMVYDDESNSYILPNEKIMENPVESENNANFSTEDTEIVEEKIMEKMNELLFFIFPPQPFIPFEYQSESESPTDLYEPQLFKGFHIDENREITMVYDATRVQLPLSTQQKYIWVSPYEIFISKSVKEIPVHDSIRNTFLQICMSEPDFHHLKEKVGEAEDKIVKTPYILFMCKNSETGYENVYSNNLTEIIFPPQIDDENIGKYTFFTNKHLIKESAEVGTQEKKENLARYAVFIDIEGLNPLFIEPTETDKINHLYDNPTDNNVNEDEVEDPF